MINKTAILFINVGTPDSPKRKDVERFLSQFLGDKRIIELPWFFRKLLVNGIIVPFRSFKSSKKYKLLWTKNGSPLLHYSQNFVSKLNKTKERNEEYFIAMRYGNPGLVKVLKEIKKRKFEKLIVFPLFPQYASSTTGSALEAVFKIIKKWYYIPQIVTIKQFYNSNLFIDGFVKRILKYNLADFDHILLSYHGLPLKQVVRSHNNESCTKHKCTSEINEINSYCYQATCYKTTQLITTKLNLEKSKYTTCFQSRFSKNWLSPFTDEVIIDLASKGAKNILVICPSFVADCLETIVEIGIEYQELFQKYGGHKLQLVESLNDDINWIDQNIFI